VQQNFAIFGLLCFAR